MWMKRCGVAGLSVVALATQAAACGGQSEKSERVPLVATETGADFSKVLATAFCDVAERCCTSRAYSFVEKDCVSSMTSYYETFADETRYTKAGGEACLALIESHRSYYQSHCPAMDGDPFDAEVQSDCTKLFDFNPFDDGESKELQPGESCLAGSSQCASTSEGRGNCALWFDATGNTQGLCQILVEGRKGDGPCLSNLAAAPLELAVCRWERGLRCETESNTCQSLRALGEACQVDDDCESSGYCLLGKCVARVGEGEDCAFDGGTQCQVNLFCEMPSMKCERLRDEGEACNFAGQCKTNHCFMGTLTCKQPVGWLDGLVCR